MKFKFHPQNLPLLAGSLVDVLIVAWHIDGAIKLPIVAFVTSALALAGWTSSSPES